MSQDVSSPLATPSFFPSSMADPAQVGMFRRLIRSHPVMAWARDRSMEDDLEQLGMIEIAKILQTFDSKVGTTPEQFVGVALRKRLFSCRRALNTRATEVPTLPDTEFKDELDLENDEFEWPAAEVSVSIHETYERREQAEELLSFIRMLPNTQRVVVEMLLQDQTEAEIAKELGVTVQAVNKAKKKAVETLRGKMAQHLN